MANEKNVWFRHDIHASSDPNMRRMIWDLGMKGVGVYWSLVEMLYMNDGSIPIRDLPGIAKTLGVSKEILKKILENFQLFEKNSEKFWSNRVNKEIDMKNILSEKKTKAIKTRWSNVEKDQNVDNISITDVLQTNNISNTPVIPIQYSTVQYNKRERENPPPLAPQPQQKIRLGTHQNVMLSQSELNDLSMHYGAENTRTYVNRLSSHMQSKGKTYADHYATVRQWLDNDIAKGQIRLPSADPVMPTVCDKCGKPLVEGKCMTCRRRIYGEGGTWQFEEIPDPGDIERFAQKTRSFA